MIDPRTLRPGCWVQSESFNIPKLDIASDGVTEITAYGIHLIEEGKWQPYPIAMDEEWADKFGFKRVGKRQMWQVHNFLLTLNGLEWEMSIKDTSNVLHVPICKGKFVHEFQNCYQVLFGKEIELI